MVETIWAHRLNIPHCRGQDYDNAAAITGIDTRVSAQIEGNNMKLILNLFAWCFIFRPLIGSIYNWKFSSHQLNENFRCSAYDHWYFWEHNSAVGRDFIAESNAFVPVLLLPQFLAKSNYACTYLSIKRFKLMHTTKILIIVPFHEFSSTKNFYERLVN